MYKKTIKSSLKAPLTTDLCRRSADNMTVSSLGSCWHLGGMSSASGRAVKEASAVLGAAYEAFLRTRIERRRGLRGKAHARSCNVILGMAVEMAANELEAVVADLAQGRGDIEHELLAESPPLDREHEWGTFLTHLGEKKSEQAV